LTGGYTKRIYHFKRDGSYGYTERNWSYDSTQIIVVVEIGNYSLSPSELVLIPSESKISSYRKIGGADALGSLVKTQKREIGEVRYRCALHYFSGINEWNLMLSADRENPRDGAYSMSGFPKTWLFDKKFVDQDLLSARVQ